MSKEELLQALKDHLKVEVTSHKYPNHEVRVDVTLRWKGEYIDSASTHFNVDSTELC